MDLLVLPKIGLHILQQRSLSQWPEVSRPACVQVLSERQLSLWRQLSPQTYRKLWPAIRTEEEPW